MCKHIHRYTHTHTCVHVLTYAHALAFVGPAGTDRREQALGARCVQGRRRKSGAERGEHGRKATRQQKHGERGGDWRTYAAEAREQTLAKEGLSHPTPHALDGVAADADDIEQSVFWHLWGPKSSACTRWSGWPSMQATRCTNPSQMHHRTVRPTRRRI